MPGSRKSISRFVPWFAAVFCAGALGIVVRSLWVGVPDQPLDADVRSTAESNAGVPPTSAGPSLDAIDRNEGEAGSTDEVDSIANDAMVASAVRDEVAAEPPVRVRGEVRDGKGDLAAGCELSIRIARQLEQRWEHFEAVRGETGSDGGFELEVPASHAREAQIASLVVVRAPAEAAIASIGATLREGGKRALSLRLEPAGGGSVRVLDADGRPVPSAVVTPHGLAQFETRTDDRGIASFPAIPVGPRRFSALAPRHPIATSENVEIATGSSFAVDLFIGRGVAVRGRVVDRDDRPLPGATVRVDGVLGSVVTSDEGTFEFEDVAPGTRRAVATLGELQAVNVEFEAPSEELVIRFFTERIAEIECVDAGGDAVDVDELQVEEVALGKVVVTNANTVRIRLESFGLAGEFAVDRGTVPPKLEVATSVDAELEDSMPIVGSSRLKKTGRVRDGVGRFRVYAQSGGDPIFVVAKHAAHGIAVAGPLDPKSARTGTRVVFGTGGRVEVVVVDSRGDPMSAEVRVSTRSRELFVTTTDARGRCEIAGLPFDDVTVSVEAEAAARQSRSLRLEPGVPVTLRFELDSGTRLYGVVADASGRPMRGAELFFHVPDDPMRAFVRAITDAEGGYRVEHLPLGTIRVRIQPDISGIRFGAEMINEFLPAPSAIEVGTGDEQRVDLLTTWPAPARIAIETRFVGSAITKVEYELRNDRGGGGFRVDGPPETLDRLSIVELDVAPGNYVLTFQSGGGSWFATAPTRLEPGITTTVRLEALSTQPLTGIVEDASGRPLSGVALYYLWTEAWRPNLAGGRAISPSCDVDAAAWRTITGGDGAFALPPGQVRGHVLVAAKKGFEPFQVAVDEELARRVPLRLRLQPKK